MAILGIDEVGRGPLAGPLVVGAVVLPRPWPEWVKELRDSKKLSAKKREELSEIILREATCGLGWVPAEELDIVGISEALRLATRRAVEMVQETKVPFSQIVIDGKINFLDGTKLGKFVSTAVKADDLIKEVSAASIIAKVARDRYMVEAGAKFPEYGFEKHVGYGTAKHLAAIREYGICAEHRKSFNPIKDMIGYDCPWLERGFDGSVDERKNTTRIGERGETVVCEYLTKNGHRIVARNFKTKICEIDIVSTYEKKIYFTEVKYRKSDAWGGGLAAITVAKQKQMRLAAEMYMKMNKGCVDYDPVLAVADVCGEEFLVREWFEIY